MKSEFKIVADSSADIKELDGVSFESAPLKIITEEKEYTDNKQLDVLEMVNVLHKYKGKSSTSCPNTDDWLNTFGDASHIFCVPITSTLSGSYNSAVIAKNIYEEMHPDRRVFVVNTLSAGPELALIIYKLKEFIESGKDFEEICRDITAYSRHTGLLFVLESMKNLANNGRVSPLVAKMAGLLGIRVIGKASDKGDLQPLNKCRGENRMLINVMEHLKELGLEKGRVIITHCFNDETAAKLKSLIKEHFPMCRIDVSRCAGLCGFYAEKGGLLIGFEKN